MRWLLWVLRIALFLLLFSFAVKNTESVDVRFFLDATWHAPMVIVLLAFFAGGVLFSMLSLYGSLAARRREVARLTRELKKVRGRLDYREHQM